MGRVVFALGIVGILTRLYEHIEQSGLFHAEFRQVLLRITVKVKKRHLQLHRKFTHGIDVRPKPFRAAVNFHGSFFFRETAGMSDRCCEREIRTLRFHVGGKSGQKRLVLFNGRVVVFRRLIASSVGIVVSERDDHPITGRQSGRNTFLPPSGFAETPCAPTASRAVVQTLRSLHELLERLSPTVLREHVRPVIRHDGISRHVKLRLRKSGHGGNRHAQHGKHRTNDPFR